MESHKILDASRIPDDGPPVWKGWTQEITLYDAHTYHGKGAMVGYKVDGASPTPRYVAPWYGLRLAHLVGELPDSTTTKAYKLIRPLTRDDVVNAVLMADNSDNPACHLEHVSDFCNCDRRRR